MAGFGNINRDVEVNNSPNSGGSVTILPDDDYELEYIETDYVAGGTGKGKNFTGKIQVVSGEHKGVWFFGGINNVEHESAQAQTIAQGELKALCLATGVDYSKIEDTKEVEYRPFWASVRTESYFSKKHNKDMQKNVVAKYLYEGMPDDAPAPSSPPASKSAATAPAATAPAEDKPAATGRMPWKKTA